MLRKVHAVHDLKLQALKELSDTATGNLLVAYNYQHELEALRRAFPKAVWLDKDPRTIDRWNKGGIPMLFSIRLPLGMEFNCSMAVVIWSGTHSPWSLELYAQANARLARQGQPEGGIPSSPHLAQYHRRVRSASVEGESLDTGLTHRCREASLLDCNQKLTSQRTALESVVHDEQQPT